MGSGALKGPGWDPSGRHPVVARCALFSGLRNVRSAVRGTGVLKLSWIAGPRRPWHLVESFRGKLGRAR